ncbi:hypothetical protein EDB85DRAFT_2286421, partial [Lactarius pseudohatsudake]
MTAIPVTGPGDPAPVSRENDGQTDPARKGTDNDVEMRDRDLEPPPVPPGASRRSSSSQSRVPLPRMAKTPLFLPSPSSEGTSSEPPIRQRDRDRYHDLLDIISIDSSSSSSSLRPPPPQRSPRKAKKQRGQEQLMAYVLLPPLPP